MFWSKMRLGATVLTVIVCAGAAPAWAGVLVGDTNAMPAYNGTTSPYSNDPNFSFTTSADVDFAVYQPGNFNLSFPGQDPSGGSDYVYAYQVFNLASAISSMTVGLDGDEPLGSITWLTGTGTVDPTAASFSGGALTSADWDFGTNIASSQSSSILIFTATAPPEWDSTTVMGNPLPAGGTVPSPLPEPASLSLLALAAALACARRPSRR
jgi:hypothetical protein